MLKTDASFKIKGGQRKVSQNNSKFFPHLPHLFKYTQCTLKILEKIQTCATKLHIVISFITVINHVTCIAAELVKSKAQFCSIPATTFVRAHPMYLSREKVKAVPKKL